MTYASTSRNAHLATAETSAIATLADVLSAIVSSDLLTSRQRQDMASAVRSVGRFLSRPLSTLPSDARSIRNLLEGIQPARHDISPGRWANIRSLTFKALDHAGVRRLPGRSSAPPTLAWQRLLQPLPYRPAQVALMPFARYCSRQGIEPDRVDQKTFEAFARELEEFGARSRPREAYLDACRAWQRARTTYPHWPTFAVSVEDRRDRYALAWSTFPPSLKADVDAMAAGAISPDLLSPTSRKPIKSVSAASRVSLLRAFASGIVLKGRDPATLRTISDLVHADAARSGLEFMLDRAGGRKTPHIHQMAKLLCTLARHHVYGRITDLGPQARKAAEINIAELDDFRRSLDPRRHGMTAKNRTTLRWFEDEVLLAKFLSLPARLLRRHQTRRKLKVSEAVQLQTGLAVEILTVAPIRCKNLVEIRLDENILDHGSAATGAFTCTLRRSTSRTGRSWNLSCDRQPCTCWTTTLRTCGRCFCGRRRLIYSRARVGLTRRACCSASRLQTLWKLRLA